MERDFAISISRDLYLFEEKPGARAGY